MGSRRKAKDQLGLFGSKQVEVEGFALVSPKGKPVTPVRPPKGTQPELVSRRVSREKLEEMRKRELAERAARKKRANNPERWLAPQLSEPDRVRLKQLHDVYFAMFDELESLPGATMSTRGGRHTVPDGYALLIQVGSTTYAFFQDASPAETWSFITIGDADTPDEVEDLEDYLAVLERVNDLVIDQVRRRPNLTTPALASDVSGALVGEQLAGIPGAVIGGLAGHEIERAVHVELLKQRLMP